MVIVMPYYKRKIWVIIIPLKKKKWKYIEKIIFNKESVFIYIYIS